MKGSLRDAFNGVADGHRATPDYGRPVSVRFTEEERAEPERIRRQITFDEGNLQEKIF